MDSTKKNEDADPMSRNEELTLLRNHCQKSRRNQVIIGVKMMALEKAGKLSKHEYHYVMGWVAEL